MVLEKKEDFSYSVICTCKLENSRECPDTPTHTRVVKAQTSFKWQIYIQTSQKTGWVAFEFLWCSPSHVEKDYLEKSCTTAADKRPNNM